MPTFSDILEASPDVLSDGAPSGQPDRTSPVAGATDFQSILEASPDLFPGRKAVPQREKRGVIGEAVHAAVAPIKALAKAPSLLTMSDDEWYQWLKEESAKETATEPADGITGGAARIAGGLAGGVAEFAVAEAGGSAVAGPVGAVAAPALAFAGSGSVESALAAGIKALQEGKTKDEVVRISRNLAGVGAVTGAGSALVFGGTGLIPKTASALARTAGTAGAGVVAGVGSQLAENIAEKKEGLDVSPTEGLLERAIIMGLLPTVLHAKDLYRQARSAKDPAIAKTIQKSADEVAKQELAKADVAPADTDTPEKKAAKEQVQKFVMGSELDTPEGARPPKKPKAAKPEVPGTEAEAEKGISVIDEIKGSGAKTIADIQRLFPQAQLNREAARRLRDQAWGNQAEPEAKPKPPEPPEPAAETVEEPPPKPPVAPDKEVSPEKAKAGSDTGIDPGDKKPVVSSEPATKSNQDSGISQQDIEKAYSADTWPKIKPPIKKDGKLYTVGGISWLEDGKATAHAHELIPVSAETQLTEKHQFTDQNRGKGYEGDVVQYKGKTYKVGPLEEIHSEPKEENAVQPESPQPVRDVLKKSESGPGEVSAAGPGAKDDARGSEEQRPEDVQTSPPVGGPVKLGQWPENEWSYEHLKKLSMTERANRSRYLGLRDKGGLLEVSAKKIADRAKQRLDEVKAEAAKPKASEPPPAPEDKKPDPEWQVTVQSPQDFPGKGTVPGYIQIDKVTGAEKEWWSSNPEKLRELGYDVPDFSKLPSGKYKLSKAVEKAIVETEEPPVKEPETKPKEEPPNKPPNKPTKKGVAEPEDKAIAKVEEAINQTVVTEGARTAKEAKSQLVEELEKAIEKAPFEAEIKASSYTTVKGKTVQTAAKSETITIHIPGDGKFTVKRTKEALAQVLDRAKKIKTTDTATRGTVQSDPSSKAARTRTLAPLEVPQDREVTINDVIAAKEQITRFEREVKERNLKDTDDLPNKLSTAHSYADRESEKLFAALHEVLQSVGSQKPQKISDAREFLTKRFNQLETLSKAEPETRDTFSIKKPSSEVNERLKRYGDDRDSQDQALIQQILRPKFQKRTNDPAYARANSVVAVRPERSLRGPFDARGTEGFEKLFGKRLVFYRDTVKGDAFEGFSTSTDADVVFVNVDAENSWIRIAGHELFHQLAGERPDLFRRVMDIVRDDLGEKNIQLAERYGENYKSEDIPEEALADFAGDQIIEPEFWRRFVEKDPNLFKRAATAIQEWLHDAVEFLTGNGYEATQFFKDVEKARNAVADALAEYAKGKREQAGRDKFSIKKGATVTATTGKAPIEQYTDELKKIEAAPVSLREKFKQAFEMGQRLAAAKDTASAAFAGLKATGDRLVKKFEGINTIDDLLRAKGELSGSTETRGWQTYQWVKWAKKAVPRTADQAAIRKWVDAGGDAGKLQEGARETKPEFRQAYVDAQNLSPENLKIAQEARKYFEAKLDEAISAGVLEDGLTDYIHRIYENHPVQRDRAVAYVQSGILRANPSLAKHRVFTFDWQAEKEGYKPVQSFIPAIAEYETSLSRAIAARKFIAKANEMMAPDNRPIIDIKGVGIPIKDADGERTGTLIKPQFNPAKANTPGTANYRGDYVTREFPALQRWKWVAADSDEKPIFVQGDVSIHPDYVHRIVSLLEPSRVRYGRLGSIMRPALAISSAFKQTMLDLSGFHQVQIAVHAVEHKVNPFNLVKDIDFENQNVQGLLKGGVTIGGDYHYSGEGLFGGSLTRQIPVLGPLAESYHNWLFRDFIPRVKMTMALKALERNRERYAGKLSEEQIFNKTAMQANSAFGGLNYTMLERSKTAQDIARLIMLAPDFLEARGRFAAEALSRGGKRFGNEQRTALLLGALTMYTAARVLNKVTDDQYHFEAENAFSWVINGQAYGLRTVQGDILHLLEKPLQFWMHRLNPVFGRTALEVGTQRDEFGRKRSFPEIVWDSASNIMPISLRSSRERSLWESLANGFGITDRRWQDTDKAFSLAKKWKDKHGIGERGEFIYDPDKDPLRRLKIALSRNDDSRAASEIKKLVDDKTYSLERLDEYFARYRHLAFTGSRANDRRFISELTEDEKITVENARQHKEQIANLYRKARGQYRQAISNSP